MFSARRPSAATIGAFRDRARAARLTYPEVGATARGPLPSGYHVDRREEVVGPAARFHAAKEALAGFRYYDAPEGRVRILEPRPPMEVDEEVILLGRHAGLYSLSACRIVYTFDEPRSFGFGYGTLEHAVSGEERFEVALDGDDVVFRLLAFSVPASWLVRLGRPLARHWQREAGRAYANAIRRCLGT